MDPNQDTPAEAAFILRFETWEGPIEALLDLAKAQKVDLAMIDILDLATQFDGVVSRAMSLKLELAADWLVMAAWLAYLKSRLLLRRPKQDGKEEDEDALAFHLTRLNAVRSVAERLSEGLVLGRDWFAPSGSAEKSIREEALVRDLAEFLSRYPRGRAPSDAEEQEPRADLKPFDLASVDAAIGYLSERLPAEWTDMLRLVPRAEGLRQRSNVASTLIASLELARDGRADIDQDPSGGPVRVKRSD